MLLRKAKNGTMENVKEHRITLIEHLTIIASLSDPFLFRWQLEARLFMAAEPIISNSRDRNILYAIDMVRRKLGRVFVATAGSATSQLGISCLDRGLDAMKREGWHHLSIYAHHWLQRLEERPEALGEVNLNTFTLIFGQTDYFNGLDIKDQHQYGYHRQFMIIVVGETVILTTLQMHFFGSRDILGDLHRILSGILDTLVKYRSSAPCSNHFVQDLRRMLKEFTLYIKHLLAILGSDERAQ